MSGYPYIGAVFPVLGPDSAQPAHSAEPDAAQCQCVVWVARDGAVVRDCCSWLNFRIASLYALDKVDAASKAHYRRALRFQAAGYKPTLGYGSQVQQGRDAATALADTLV